jgi:hypothetical protein
MGKSAVQVRSSAPFFHELTKKFSDATLRAPNPVQTLFFRKCSLEDAI